MTNELLEAPPDHRPPQGQNRAQHSVRSGKGLRPVVLLVEDDAVVREATASMLERSGHRVLAAATDDEAQWLWRHHRREVDLLVTDLMIPRCCTGLDLIRRFRLERPELPVLLTSGFGRDLLEEDPLYPAGLPFLQKPFSPAALNQVVSELLGPRA